MTDQTVLLTGASGFIAKHVLQQLLAAGHPVRASLRTPGRADQVRAAVLPGLPAETADRLSFVTLDLTRDDGWAAALQGCAALVHTASPFPIQEPRDPQDLIRPAVEGTRRALMAAAAAGVRRVVLTSSIIAIENGRDGILDESDWADPDARGATAYGRSKTLAERAAWKIAADRGLQLTTINPGLVLGPLLDGDYGSSVGLIARMMRGRDPMMPRLGFPIVDVRDVATAHVRALATPAAAGLRIAAVADSAWLADLARALKQAWPDRRLPTRTAPDVVVRLLALFDPQVRAALPMLGRLTQMSNARARSVLGMDFIPAALAARASAESLIALGRV
jgi:dihydroflavonol-4-reductase